MSMYKLQQQQQNFFPFCSTTVLQHRRLLTVYLAWSGLEAAAVADTPTTRSLFTH